ncbi:MAG: GUN4 domain-containing protein [Elainellaceae cyanobacterium]
MARVALLIGTGTYGEGFKPLPAAPKDVEAIAAVLSNPDMGGFDQVDQLIDQTHSTISETIETWFRERKKDDVALLYISGHGVKDDQRDLYFAACDTKKRKEDLVRATAISASVVRDRIQESKAKRQVIILDCCFSGAFGDLLVKDDNTIDLKTLLGAEGRVVLTSSSSLQYSFEQRGGSLSIYTHYLVEGIRTGAADVDEDGEISVQELHDYAKRKVQEESPAMTPRIIVLKDEGYQIRIAKAPLGDPKVKYRKEVEAIVQEDGDTIDEILSRPVLEALKHKLGLFDGDVQAIEADILEPIRQRQAKIQRYREVFTRALQHKNSLGQRERKRLQQLQHILGLRDEDIQAVEDEVTCTTPPNLPDLFFTPSIPLESEKGMDYIRLRDLLKAGKWNEALLETFDLLEHLRADKTDWCWFSSEDISQFSCIDLRTIDNLWVSYSDGRFGFSIQTRIFLECGGNFKYPFCKNKDAIEKFGDLVGWRINEKWDESSSIFDNIRNPKMIPTGYWPYFCFDTSTGCFEWIASIGLKLSDCNSKIGAFEGNLLQLVPTCWQKISLPQVSPLTNEILLESEKEVDYEKLQKLLHAGKWKEADQEAAQRMLQAMNKKRWGNIETNDLINFPCKDLKTIDRLWVHYSNGKFGWSVQKQMYAACGAKLDGKHPGDEIWKKFCDRAGWNKEGKGVKYNDLTFDLIHSSKGELPAWLFLDGFWFVADGVAFAGGVILFSRMEACEL